MRIRFVATLELPLTSGELLGDAFLDKIVGSRPVHFYHGSHRVDALASFQWEGVLPWSGRTRYTRRESTHWTTSSVFAVWWAVRARLQRTAEARRLLPVDQHDCFVQLRMNIPAILSDVQCLVTVVEWPAQELFEEGSWKILKTKREEDAVCKCHSYQA